MEEMSGLMGQSIISQMMSSLWQHMLNRSDYDHTFKMTSYPNQVEEMKKAGLNPALAYGQLSAPQGQSLGNYQTDIAEAASDFSRIPIVKEQLKTQEAQTDYYNALAFKTRMEGLNREFLNTHQEESWNLDFEGRTLSNIGTNLDNTSKFLHNLGQVTANDIAKIEFKMKNFDWEHYSETKAAELNSLVAETGLKIAMAKTENVLRSEKLRNLKAETKNLMALQFRIWSERNLIEQQRLSAKFDAKLKKLDYSYMNWLSNGGKDWTKYDLRNKFSTYAPAVASGLRSAVDIGALILSRGKSAGLLNPGGFTSPTYSLGF